MDQGELGRWFSEHKNVLSAYPELDSKRKVSLGPEFVRALLRAHPDFELSEAEMLVMLKNAEFPELRADEWELHQRIFVWFESSENRRFKIYGAVASGIILLKRIFSGGLKKQLGTKKRTLFKVVTAIAQNLEWLGAALRGDMKEPPGRVNVELAGLVDAILEHQKEPLTQVELYGAVKAAGGEVPEDPEAFRLWLHRARKEGLVKNFSGTRNKLSRILRSLIH